MILSRITAYLREHKRASLLDMSYALEATPDALKAMLSTLERKGRVRRLPGGTACGGGCSKCDPHSVELYEWADE
jgi:predicted ArsR family transcriptional regulator